MVIRVVIGALLCLGTIGLGKEDSRPIDKPIPKVIPTASIEAPCEKIMVTAKQSPSQCFKACREAVKSLGLIAGNERFQIALESNGKLVPVKGLMKGLDYGDSLLSLGIPIIVGVHNKFDYRLANGSWPNSDKTTDHFIVMTSKTSYWDPYDNAYYRDIAQSNYQVTQIRIYDDTRDKGDSRRDRQ